jgi:organic hydroperoxide reductase OsmC/OhrA
MRISASVKSAGGTHEVTVSTQDSVRVLAIPAKRTGGGSAVNGGEFLMLALATCYCNDLYREASRLGITVVGLEVQAFAEFAGVGLAASNVMYRARVQSNEPPERIEQLLRETDAVAEVHNTVRGSVEVRLVPWEDER